MKRFRNLVMFAMLVGATLLPGLAMTTSAQDADFCAAAAEAATGGASDYAGYAIVYGSGGAGDQIVLGSLDGNDYLSGGSGNDVLCAWGNANTLDGGSGSDVLIAVDGEDNVLLGGSGNDTLMGYINNTFDGGSGRNDVVEWEPVRGPIWIEGKYIMGEGFPPGEIYVTVLPGYYSTAVVDGNGQFESGEWGFCEGPFTGDVTIIINKGEGGVELGRATLTLNCT